MYRHFNKQSWKALSLDERVQMVPLCLVSLIQPDHDTGLELWPQLHLQLQLPILNTLKPLFCIRMLPSQDYNCRSKITFLLLLWAILWQRQNSNCGLSGLGRFKSGDKATIELAPIDKMEEFFFSCPFVLSSLPHLGGLTFIRVPSSWPILQSTLMLCCWLSLLAGTVSCRLQNWL